MSLKEKIIMSGAVVGFTLIVGGGMHSSYQWQQRGYSFWDEPRKSWVVYPDGDWNKVALAGYGLVTAGYLWSLKEKQG
jgi:hypothetical protein